MSRDELFAQVKQAIHTVEPDAEIILYGSHAREDANPESDWDLLVLVNGPVTDERKDAIRHRLYRIEWASDEVLCSVVYSRQEWQSPRSQAMPLYQNVNREGRVL